MSALGEWYFRKLVDDNDVSDPFWSRLSCHAARPLCDIDTKTRALCRTMKVFERCQPEWTINDADSLIVHTPIDSRFTAGTYFLEDVKLLLGGPRLRSEALKIILYESSHRAAVHIVKEMRKSPRMFEDVCALLVRYEYPIAFSTYWLKGVLESYKIKDRLDNLVFLSHFSTWCSHAHKLTWKYHFVTPFLIDSVNEVFGNRNLLFICKFQDNIEDYVWYFNRLAASLNLPPVIFRPKLDSYDPGVGGTAYVSSYGDA